MESVDAGEARSLREDALAGGARASGAFERLWSAYFRRLTLFAATFRGLPASEREDAVAETLIAAFAGLAGYDPDRPLSAWIHGLARNRFADAARSCRRGAALSLEALPAEPAIPGHADSIVDRLGGEEAEGACAAALSLLPEADRRVAILCFLEGLDSTEAGRVLGLAPGTVRWRLHRVRAAVAARLGGMP